MTDHAPPSRHDPLRLLIGSKFPGRRWPGAARVIAAAGVVLVGGAFLGSALMLATSQGNMLEGVVMLLLYSLGLGIPFFVSAILIDRLKGAFTFIKRHYQVINIVSGAFLVVIGVLMATGLFGQFLALLS